MFRNNHRCPGASDTGSSAGLPSSKYLYWKRSRWPDQLKETDGDTIELVLDILLSMLKYGVGNELFYRLHQYYKNINRQRFITYQALSAHMQ